MRRLDLGGDGSVKSSSVLPKTPPLIGENVDHTVVETSW
jgi:hypothetical protein